MALFVATAHVHVDPQMKYEDLKDFHNCLDNGINRWTKRNEELTSGFVVVDITITYIDNPFLLVTASYRSAAPTEFSLQESINRALYEDDEI